MTALRVPDRFRVPKIVWIWLERLGLTPMAVLRHARLPSALYDGERTSVTTAQFFALWRSIAELRPQPDLGLRLARELELGQLSPATLASFHARDYRDALGRLSRFKQLCSPEEMHLHEARGQCTVETVWTHTREPAPPLLVDATLALILELGRRGTQTALKPVRVELVRRRGASTSWRTSSVTRTRILSIEPSARGRGRPRAGGGRETSVRGLPRTIRGPPIPWSN